MSLHYDMAGEPMALEEWCKLFEDPVRLLAQEWVHVRDGRRVWLSTVWIGIDHNFAGSMMQKAVEQFAEESEEKETVLAQIDTRPWIFETMAFEQEKPGFFDVFAKSGGNDGGQWRHATYDEAVRFHASIREDPEL